MSHSRIFGITTKKDNNYSISENNYEKYANFSDYVQDLNEKETVGALEWLKSYLERNFEGFVDFDTNNASMTFKRGFRAMFEEKQMEKIREIIDSTERYSTKCYMLKQTISDDYGFHFEEDGGWPDTFEEFALYLTEETPYYFYGALDYHN